MSRPATSSGRTGRPPLTSRAEILRAAHRLIGREGWETLTIRRLAAELGIGPTTLYRHIKDKEDLLVLLLNDHLDQSERPVLPDDPKERIVAAATAMHDVLADWPWAAEVLAVDGFIARLDESALWMVEAVLSGASDCGCGPEQGVELFRNLWYYTVGEILVRARSARVVTDEERRTFVRHFDASRTPHLAAVSSRWGVVAGRDTYTAALRAFVDGLLAQATPTP
ncbi:TetR/AcrR family transcriptional regulator [Actinomadura oligospora]|uniref:TetR/AcrR family transcriptional regulator n=1 Tax=Actinomadura oligospora TaxID=111804 RepID=UPI0004BAFD5F|nr:TetR/AcrR family transcriptional regulator [Actinomadura oligospora]